MIDDAVVQPMRPVNWPDAPSLALMIGNPSDMSEMVSRAGLGGKRTRNLLNSRIHFDHEAAAPVCIAGPFIGAPYAVILLETLIAWGVKGVIFFGWCGAIHPDVHIGDLVVPSAAFVEDGTAPHYLPGKKETDYLAEPSADFNATIMSGCGNSGLSFHHGPVWTTDAVFRETLPLIEKYRDKGALAVEMEASALFAAGAFRGIPVAAVLAVSDELHSPDWHPGFGAPRFRRARISAVELISGITDKLQDLLS